MKEIPLSKSDVLAVFDGGWVQYLREGQQGEVLICFEPSTSGRLAVAQVRLKGAITGTSLRNLPLGRIEAAVNSPNGRSLLLESLEKEVKQDEQGDLFATLLRPHLKATVHGRRGPSLRLPTAAKPGKKPDDFYRRAAEAYSHLVAGGSRRPAIDLASANGVPVTSVHRWIKEARRRGLLAPGQRG